MVIIDFNSSFAYVRFKDPVGNKFIGSGTGFSPKKDNHCMQQCWSTLLTHMICSDRRDFIDINTA